MTHKKWLWQQRGKACVTNLKKHGFDAHFLDSVDEVNAFLLSLLLPCDSIGFGGSSTISRLGIQKRLAAEGKTIYDHNREGLDFEQKQLCRKAQGRCGCFLTSANAVVETGEIINVDGVGNRTSAMTFGPDKVVVVAGINKLRPTISSALARIREIAAPMRARDLGMDTPCARTGICVDCNSPSRICNITTILHRRPLMTDISVLIVNEEIGY